MLPLAVPDCNKARSLLGGVEVPASIGDSYQEEQSSTSKFEQRQRRAGASQHAAKQLHGAAANEKTLIVAQQASMQPIEV